MKKFIVISIVIAAAIAVFAAVALKDGVPQTAETAKPAAEKQLEKKNIDTSVPLKTLKIQKIQPIDREKLRNNLKKIKEKREKDPDYSPKRESCGG